MTLKEYLEGLFEEGIFTEANFNSVFAKYNVSGSEELEEIGNRERDLCEADLCLLVANKSNGSGEVIERGNFRISERSWNMTYSDRERLVRKAWFLYNKWGEEVYEGGEYHYQIGVIDD